MAPGSYRRGRNQTPGASDYYEITADYELPEHVARVNHAYALDKYEVTVARFRAFVLDYDRWRGSANPQVGAGAHPALPGTGWKQIWSDDTKHLPLSSALLVAQLHCEPGKATWTDAPNTLSDNLPINCINWYVAGAFCIWDGGRLPTETEWEYVAANGSDNRLYPWGNTAPDKLTANCSDTDNTPFLPVGSKPAGASALGHLDLGGSMQEWMFDSLSLVVYETYAITTCEDCYFTSESSMFTGSEPYNVLRGGAWILPPSAARSAARIATDRYGSYQYTGIRCARSVTP